MDSEIPKRIIHVWGKGENDLTLASKAAIVNAKLLNPDFEYLFYDDERIEKFVGEHFPEYQGFFNLFREPIQRYDFFRYLAIYQFGGFYLDLDVFLVSSLKDLLKLGCVFSFEELSINRFMNKEYGMDWEIGNYAFGATAGHPFIRAIIENCVRAQKDLPWLNLMIKSVPRLLRDEYYVLYTTGPGLVSRTLAEYSDSNRQVKVLFPDNVCDKKNWCHFGKYGTHLQAGKWKKNPNNVWRHFMRFIKGKLFVYYQEKRVEESKKKGPKRSL